MRVRKLAELLAPKPIYLTEGRRVANCFRLVSRSIPHLDIRGTLTQRDPMVAIVGARAATAADRQAATRLAEAVVARGGVVVSGGALGVDGAAHAAALAAGGATVVVAGTGVDVDYPQRHAALFAAIVASGQGAVVSQFPRGTRPLPRNFAIRNETIAALAELVIVIGAGARSGSLYTVAAARRPVVTPPPAESDGALLLTALSDRDPRDLEDLTHRTGLPLRAAQRALADLELRGLVHLAVGQAYVRSSFTA